MRRPNILIVMTDHQRGDTVLPEHPCRTPNLDRFGKEGVIFTDAYCPSPHCCPARATFMTGTYPSTHGVWNNIRNPHRLSAGVRPEVPMWSTDLRAAGYDLVYGGKWHVSTTESPADRGWRELPICAERNALHGETWDSYAANARHPRTGGRAWGEIVRRGWPQYRAFGTMQDENASFDQRVVRQAMEELPKLAARQNPWCMFAGLIGPHDPYFVPQRHIERHALSDIPLPASYGDTMADKPGLYRRARQSIWGQFSGDEVRDTIRHFWAYCSWLDELFGQLLECLEATGQAENTLVLYCSDHGDYCGEHGLFCKSLPCFKGAYHVPWVMRWPQGIATPGRRVNRFVSLADASPTFLELAGIATDRHSAGSSLVPFLRNEEPAVWRDAVYTQCNGVEIYANQRSITTATHKYVHNMFDFDELYDLRADPHEMVNRINDASLAPVLEELSRKLWQFAMREGDVAPNSYITLAFAPYGPETAFEVPKPD